LNKLAKERISERIAEAIKAIKEDDFEFARGRGRELITFSEIFKDDTEWAEELSCSGLLWSASVGTASDYLEGPVPAAQKEKLKEILTTYLQKAKESLDKEDWLDFHKNFRSMWYNTVSKTP